MPNKNPAPAFTPDNGATFTADRKRFDVTFLKNARGPFVQIIETNLDSPRRNVVIVPIDRAHVFAASILDMLEDYDTANDTVDGTAKDRILYSNYEQFTTS